MFTPLTTDRLVIRGATGDDLETLLARRNDPEVARYQSWSIPFDRQEAVELLAAIEAQGDLAVDEWWMLTITDKATGTQLGDVAVQLQAGGHAAEIGYSFAPEHWGHGYATEAVDAVLDHLYDDRGVTRVWASLHSDNHASARLLERTGFLYEGLAKLAGRDPADEGPLACDVLTYGLVAADRAAWLARPRARPATVELVAITNENHREVMELATHRSQERLVAPVAVSYANALFPPIRDGTPIAPHPRAITADGQLVGFVMTAGPTEDRPEPYLWRLLVDRLHQRRGIGAMALDLLESELREAGHRSILVSWAPGPGSPARFYLARGYEPTGHVSDGEVQARLSLGDRS